MADEMVLKAQKWVNSTYGSVAGFVRAPETGTTGWSTMHSLTRALQHELGITTLSDSFGPTTLSRLEARGPISSSESNTNILKIIQAGFFCKGYHAGDIDGDWGSRTWGVSLDWALHSMMDDLGLRDVRDDTLRPKVFKALLTMDAYVLLSGGDTEVRKIQQWLNSKYWGKSWFSLIPCEGHYSRDVQKALMMALQSTFGIPDSSVTGNFGPATQQGLRDHQIAEGATGIYVQLLSAACVFNGKVLTRDGTPVHTVFKDTFDSALSQYLTVFQQFSLLAVNGRADYATWCQLLVSMGDADRPASASDTRFTITQAMAQSLVASGYKVVGRYLDEQPTSTLDKEIKPGELAAIFAGGMRVFPIWQYNSRQLSDFSYSQGYDHAQRAHDRMVHYGFNPGAIIYFAVDYDATDPEIDSNILPYFRGVQAGLISRGRKYLTGVYGSRNVCSRASNECQVAASFVSGMSWGFSGNLGFPLPHNWAFNQIKEIRYTGGGQTIDLDRDVHRPSIDRGVGADGVGGGAESPLSEVFDYVDAVWGLAVQYGGTDTNKRVMEFLRAPKYTQQYKGWDVLLGSWDQDWIDWAQARINRITEFRDPTYNEFISIDHLAATANAYYLKGAGSGSAVTRGDFGGWGGDISTFYGDWRTNESSYASGYAFCMDRMAKRGVASSYGFNDMVEDVDGYLIGMACKAGASFHTEFRRHLGGTSQGTRFRQFWSRRFGSSEATAVATARTMLVDVGADDTLDGLRDLAVMSAASPLVVQPRELAPERLTPFLEGFAKTLADLAATG